MAAPAAEIVSREVIFRIAGECGFDLAGIADARVPEQDQQDFRLYLREGRHGEMDYLEEFLAAREDPNLVMSGTKSALVLATFYRDPAAEKALAGAKRRIARYALGPDYHLVLRKRGWILKRKLREAYPRMRTRFCVDTAPVAEKSLARQAGIAFRGKHTNMIHPNRGSYFFLSVMLLDAWVEPDMPARDRCGSCRLCIDACPTSALEEYRIDPRKCISYLTIETQGPVPEEYRGKLAGNIFGCDICQEVCPYNRSDFAGANWLPLRESALAFLENKEVSPADLIAGSSMVRINEEKLKDNIRAS